MNLKAKKQVFCNRQIRRKKMRFELNLHKTRGLYCRIR